MFQVVLHVRLLRRSITTTCTKANAIHPYALTGFSKGELYDKARPSYQPEVISYVRSAVRRSPPLNVAEIGAGSGIFTRAMLAHPEWSSSIGRLRAVEPSEQMRTVFSETIKDERVTVANGVFEKTGIEDNWADVVVMAQSLHWAPDFNAAMAETARILVSQGVLAGIWNLDDRESARWLSDVRNRIEQYDKGTPHVRHGHWRRAFQTPSYLEFFGPPVETVFTYKLPRTLDRVVMRALSSSYVTALPDDEQAKIKEDVEEIVKRGEGKVWIDESMGVFEYPLKTTLMIAGKK